jgi:hypothetical protein
VVDKVDGPNAPKMMEVCGQAKAFIERNVNR